MKIQRKWVVVALVCSAAAVISGGVCIAETYRERGKAEELLTVIRQIRVGVTGYQSVLRLTDGYQGFRTISVEQNQSELEFRFDNMWLARLRLAPYVVVRIVVRCRAGLVISKSALVFVPDTGCGAHVTEMKRGTEAFFDQDQPNRLASRELLDRGATRITIQDDDTYWKEGRNRDWDFDLSCMTRLLRPCRDARTILPKFDPGK